MWRETEIVDLDSYFYAFFSSSFDWKYTFIVGWISFLVTPRSEKVNAWISVLFGN